MLPSFRASQRPAAAKPRGTLKNLLRLPVVLELDMETFGDPSDEVEVGDDGAGVVNRPIVKAVYSESLHIFSLDLMRIASQFLGVAAESFIRIAEIGGSPVERHLSHEFRVLGELTETRSVMRLSILAPYG